MPTYIQPAAWLRSLPDLLTHDRIRFRRLLYILLISLASLQLQAEESYYLKNYTAYDGLPSTNILHVFQDSRDFLWILTDAGISRFDGRDFRNYGVAEGLEGPGIVAVCEDGNHNLWFASDKGFVYEFIGNHFNKKPFRFNGINQLVYWNSAIWIASEEGLFTILGEKAYSYSNRPGLVGLKISCLLGKNDSCLLIGTTQGIIAYNGREFSPFGKVPRNFRVFNMAADGSELIWIVDRARNVLCGGRHGFSAVQGLKLNGQVGKSQRGCVPAPVLINVRGEAVIPGWDRLILYKAGRIHDIDLRDSVFRITKDFIQGSQGIYWLATSRGLYAIRPTVIKRYKVPGDNVAGLYQVEGQGGIFFSNGENIFQLSGDAITPLRLRVPPDMERLKMFAKEADGSYLFGSFSDGLKRYSEGMYSWIYRSADFGPTSAFLNNAYQTIIAGDRTLFIYKAGLLNVIQLPVESRVNCMLQDNQKLYLGTDNGLLVYEAGLFTKLHMPLGDSSLVISGIEKNPLGGFLISTQGRGLLLVNIKADVVTLDRRFFSGNGLATDYINGTATDGISIWIIAKNGIYKVRDRRASNPVIEYLNTDDGVPPYSWSESPILIQGENIYVGGLGGLISFAKNAEFRSKLDQNTFINAIEVNNARYDWKLPDSVLTFSGWPSTYVFKPGENSIRFQYAGVNLLRPSRVIFEYILKGYHKTKITTRAHSAHFINLPPGDYQFAVRSTSNIGFTNERYTTFSFSIQAPFWKTWWFSLIIVGLIAGAVYILFAMRIRHLNAIQKKELDIERQLSENKILAFQARMNPHFIFNSLNSIQYFITRNDKLSSLLYLSKFAMLLRQTLDSSFEPRILLKKEIVMLRSYIEMEELRFEHAFSFSIDIADEDLAADIRIPGMIVQPFVENAIVHGLLNKPEKGALKISFRRELHQVVCTVDDDGVGRKKAGELNNARSTSHESHGTSIAVNRLQLLNDKSRGIINRVVFIDKNENGVDTGTTVIIYLPIL